MSAGDPQTIIRTAENYDLSEVIERYQYDYGLSKEIAESHAKEIKRFLALCAIEPKERLGMRGAIDDFWHTFIFFTKPYSDFCQKVAGTYLHHIPEGIGDKNSEAGKESSSSYKNTLKLYRKYFGADAPPELWPNLNTPRSPNGCSHGGGNSCRGCGSGCSGCGHGCRGCNRCSHG